MVTPTTRFALIFGLLLTACGSAPTKPSIGSAAKSGSNDQVYKGGDATASTTDTSDSAWPNGTNNSVSTGSSNSGDSTAANTAATTAASNNTGMTTTTGMGTTGTTTTGNTQTTTNTNIDATAGIDCKTFKWENIKKPEEAACFSSNTAAFAAIPDAVKPFWTLMRNSRSAQKSTLENPRLIMFAPNGAFLVGTATDPSARKDMEVAVFDNENNQWQFAGIDFTTTPPTVEKELCKTCHGKDATHPIWTPYGQWNGAYAANNTLKDDESAMLQKIAQGSGDVPAILKNMKMNAAGDYASGKRLAPAVKQYAGENSQVLNYVVMQKSAQMAVARILADGKATAADLVKMSADITCNNGQNTLKSLGYSIENLMRADLEGTDRQADIFNGRFSSRYYLSAELLHQAMKKDPSLSAKLPDAAKQFADARYQYFTTKGLTEYNAFAAASKVGIRSIMSDFLSPSAGSGLGPTLGGSAHCNAANGIQ